MPKVRCPCAWWLRSSVTVAMGLSPAFSASVNGMTSRASANARTQYCSIPVRVCECSSRRIASSISGAPPPAISALQTVDGRSSVRTITQRTRTHIKVKECIVLREFHLRTTGRHLSMGSHSVICHLTQVTAAPSRQPSRLVLNLSTP